MRKMTEHEELLDPEGEVSPFPETECEFGHTTESRLLSHLCRWFLSIEMFYTLIRNDRERSVRAMRKAKLNMLVGFYIVNNILSNVSFLCFGCFGFSKKISTNVLSSMF